MTSTDLNIAEMEDILQPPVAVKASRKASAPDASARKTIRIILDESDDIPPSGLFLQHNGRPFMLQPGVEVDIPLFLQEILDHAVLSMPVVNPQTRQITGYRSRLKHTYRVVS
jgi:hypothetical protein